MIIINYIFLLIYLIIGYFFGSFPVGYLYCKKFNINIFEVGSNNPGSTNVGRILGKKHGMIVFVLDLIKAILPILICILYYNLNNNIGSECKYYILNDLSINFNNYDIIYINKKLIVLTVGLGCILGHNFSIFTKFKGGKGVTVTLAVILLFNFIYALFLFVFYKLVSKITKYVSLGSMLALFFLSFLSLIFTFYNIYPFNFKYKEYTVVYFFIYATIGILRHSTNIHRLIIGSENKINN